MDSQIITHPAVTFKVAQGMQGVCMLNIRGVLCAVPRGQVNLEYVEEKEQARDWLILAAQECNATNIEDALETFERTIIRNYEHEQRLIEKYHIEAVHE